ncbi:reverse transcriptase domain-containing protein [Tanacetum coccineum]|uniref:Reverse transcriptase domain-containing protein n=1 Tax=Tanacetum coccineum TaxID=301880 RepID=A0ABQ4WK92_9ASTR
MRESWKSKIHDLEENEETNDQLVSRYIGGLRAQSMDYGNMFDPARQSDGNIGPVSKRVLSSILKCLNCDEHGHRQSECKKTQKRHLFVDPDEWEVNDVADED